jgi:hypothetical protein
LPRSHRPTRTVWNFARKRNRLIRSKKPVDPEE